jgi:hypothetical protein
MIPICARPPVQSGWRAPGTQPIPRNTNQEATAAPINSRESRSFPIGDAPAGQRHPRQPRPAKAAARSPLVSRSSTMHSRPKARLRSPRWGYVPVASAQRCPTTSLMDRHRPSSPVPEAVPHCSDVHRKRTGNVCGRGRPYARPEAQHRSGRASQRRPMSSQARSSNA